MKKVIYWVVLIATFVLGIVPVPIMWIVTWSGNAQTRSIMEQWFERMNIPYTIVNVLFFVTLALGPYIYRANRQPTSK